MAEGAEKPHASEPIGVMLMKGLTDALLKNTASNHRLAVAQEELAREIAAFREDLEAVGGLTDDLCGHMTAALRVLDHVAIIGVERTPTWKDVQEVLVEIKDELEREEQEEEEEEPQQKSG